MSELSAGTDLGFRDQELTGLIAKTAHGDEEALGALYDSTSSQVYGLALRVLDDPQAAEEVVLDVYMQVWKQASQFDLSRGKPIVWLAVLTRSRAIDRLRAGQSERSRREPLGAIEEECDPCADPEVSVVQSEQHGLVLNALASLTPEQRDVIELAYFGGLSQSEIASKIGEPLGTVKTRARLGMIKHTQCPWSVSGRISLMKHPNPSDEILEQAALYALGALDGEELQAFEKRVAEGCSVCQAVEDFQGVAEQLATGVQPVKPRSELRAKLFARIKSETGSASSKSQRTFSQSETSPAGLTFVPAHAEGWQEVAPGFSLKTLFFDQAQGRMTALARMAPGCNYPIHRHDKPEELYVLEGTCYCGGRLLYPGDYHRAEAETIHEETSTPDGCLMLLIFSPNNEMLDPVSA